MELFLSCFSFLLDRVRRGPSCVHTYTEKYTRYSIYYLIVTHPLSGFIYWYTCIDLGANLLGFFFCVRTCFFSLLFSPPQKLFSFVVFFHYLPDSAKAEGSSIVDEPGEG